jgi:pimeloyl-ACP methyl ester carboxylesterase
MNSKMNFILHFDEAGSGLPVLLIHGFPFSSRMWRPQLESLSGQARLLAPDLPGFGDSPVGEPPYNVDLLAEDCLSVLDTLDITEPAVVGGLSMGGYVALAFARLFPDRMRGLMLLSTRAGADSAEGKANRDKSIAQVEQNGPSVITEGMYPKFLAPNNYTAKPEIATELKEIMKGATREGVVAALTAMRDRPDSTELLKTISVPTLVIHGREDQVIPFSEAEVMAKAIANSELHLIDNAGHLPNLEQPAEFNRYVGEFLKKV